MQSTNSEYGSPYLATRHLKRKSKKYALVYCEGRKRKFFKTRGTVCNEDLNVKGMRADCFCQCKVLILNICEKYMLCLNVFALA